MYRHLSATTMWSLLISLFLITLITGKPVQVPTKSPAKTIQATTIKIKSGLQITKNVTSTTAHPKTTEHPKITTQLSKTTDHAKATTVHPTLHPNTTTVHSTLTTHHPNATTEHPTTTSAHPTTTSTTEHFTTDHPTLTTEYSTTTEHPITTDPPTTTTQQSNSSTTTEESTTTTDPPMLTTESPNTTENPPTSPTPTLKVQIKRSHKNVQDNVEFLDYSDTFTTTSPSTDITKLEKSLDAYYRAKQREMVDLYDKYGVDGARKVLLRRLSIDKEEVATEEDEKFVSQMLYGALKEYQSERESNSSRNSINATTTRSVHKRNQTDSTFDDLDRDYVDQINRYSKDTVTLADYQSARKEHRTLRPPITTTTTTHRPPSKVFTLTPPTTRTTTTTTPSTTTEIQVGSDEVESPPPTKPETRSLSLSKVESNYSSESFEQTEISVPLVEGREHKSFLAQQTKYTKTLETFDRDELVIEEDEPEVGTPEKSIYSNTRTDLVETMYTDIDVSHLKVPHPRKTTKHPKKPKMDLVGTIDYTQTESDSRSALEITESSTIRKNGSGAATVVGESSACPTVTQLFNKAKEFWEGLEKSTGFGDGMGKIWKAVLSSVKVLGRCVFQVAVEIFLQFLSGTSLLDIFKGKGGA